MTITSETARADRSLARATGLLVLNRNTLDYLIETRPDSLAYWTRRVRFVLLLIATIG